MNKAKRRVGPLSPWIATVFGFGLVFFESGCAELTGLRSVAPDRTSVLSLWDRPQVGSPAPGTDHYAANVHGERERAGLETKSTDSPLLAQNQPIDPLEPGQSPELAANTEPSRRSSDAGASTDPDRDTRTYVTLGRPEPLPALALGAQSRKLVSASSSGSWRPERATLPSANASETGTLQARDSREFAQGAAESVNGSLEKPNASEAEAILAKAEAKLSALKTYKVKVSRIERVAGQLAPPEELSISVRTEPRAVRLEWPDGPNRGREVIYSSALDPKMIFVHVASSAIPLPAMKIAIDSPLVMRNSRHSITEAGLETIVEKLRRAGRHEVGNSAQHDDLEYRGLEKPPGVDHPCNQFVIRSATGDVWKIFLDPRSDLPCMVIGEDQRGELIERYVYREIAANPTDLGLADAFEPEKRWGESKGFLSRLARAATGPDLPANSQTRTR